MIEASRLGVVTEMPASNRPKLREVVLYFDSMPNAMLEVPIVAESNMSGDWFRPTEMDKAAFLKDCWNLRLSWLEPYSGNLNEALTFVDGKISPPKESVVAILDFVSKFTSTAAFLYLYCAPTFAVDRLPCLEAL